MQIGESVSPGLIADEQHDDSCYFCQATEEPASEANDLDDDPDDDSLFEGLEEKGIRLKNDSSKLGRACGGTPDRKTVTVDADSFGSSVAAHHLIPGNASLKKSKFITEEKYIWTEGSAKGNIGYNVNSRANGVWLPGNYAMRGQWRDPIRTAAFRQAYAFASIEAWDCQFHDSHENYSNLVLDALDVIFGKLERQEDIVCPEAKKKADKKPEEQSPMRALVGRLNTVSARMKRKLVMPGENWFRNVYTSVFSLQYMNAISPPTKRRR